MVQLRIHPRCDSSDGLLFAQRVIAATPVAASAAGPPSGAADGADDREPPDREGLHGALAAIAGVEEELRALLIGRPADELQARAESAGADPSVVQATLEAALNPARGLLELVISLEAAPPAPCERRDWRGEDVLRAVREGICGLEEVFVALPTGTSAGAPRLLVVLPSTAMPTDAEVVRMVSRGGQVLRVNTFELELGADWVVTVRVLGRPLLVPQLRALLLWGADGLGWIAAMDWPGGPTAAPPRLQLQTDASNALGPAAVVLNLLACLVRESLHVCEAIPIAGHEAMLADRARHNSTAGLLFGQAAPGGARPVAASEELLPEWLGSSVIGPDAQRVIRPTACARLVLSRPGNRLVTRQCGDCAKFQAGSLRNAVRRTPSLAERVLQESDWVSPHSTRPMHGMPSELMVVRLERTRQVYAAVRRKLAREVEKVSPSFTWHVHALPAHPQTPVTKIVQGWPKLWANFRALIGIFSQTFGPSLAIWANPVQFSLVLSEVRHNHAADAIEARRRRDEGDAVRPRQDICS